MSCHFRSLWVFHETFSDEISSLELLTSRRFLSVEKRWKGFCHDRRVKYEPIESDEETRISFISCILQERTQEVYQIPNLAASMAPDTDEFVYGSSSSTVLGEDTWPFGPVCKIANSWPFLFHATDTYPAGPGLSCRYYVCGCVALFEDKVESLFNLPAITCGFDVLAQLSTYLPHCPPNAQAALLFQYYVKTALPFGSPAITSVDILKQLSSTNMTQSDINILSLPKATFSASRLPAWKPFPIIPGPAAATLNLLRLSVSENICIEMRDGQILHSAAQGMISCDCDIPGTPEVVMPVETQRAGFVSLSFAECAKFADCGTDDLIRKISFIPKNISNFSICNYRCGAITEVPFDASFRLFQISPTQFKFHLFVKLRIQFAQFSVSFAVSDEPVRIAGLGNLELSGRTKVEVVENDSYVLWTFKSPSTFSADGEQLEGVIHTEGISELGSGDCAVRAEMNFRIHESYVSKLKILKDNVSVFPNTVLKNNVHVTYETVSRDCFIVNSAVDPQLITGVPKLDLSDCVELPPAVDPSH